MRFRSQQARGMIGETSCVGCSVLGAMQPICPVCVECVEPDDSHRRLATWPTKPGGISSDSPPQVPCFAVPANTHAQLLSRVAVDLYSSCPSRAQDDATIAANQTAGSPSTWPRRSCQLEKPFSEQHGEIAAHRASSKVEPPLAFVACSLARLSQVNCSRTTMLRGTRWMQPTRCTAR